MLRALLSSAGSRALESEDRSRVLRNAPVPSSLSLVRTMRLIVVTRRNCSIQPLGSRNGARIYRRSRVLSFLLSPETIVSSPPPFDSPSRAFVRIYTCIYIYILEDGSRDKERKTGSQMEGSKKRALVSITRYRFYIYIYNNNNRLCKYIREHNETRH